METGIVGNVISGLMAIYYISAIILLIALIVTLVNLIRKEKKDNDIKSILAELKDKWGSR